MTTSRGSLGLLQGESGRMSGSAMLRERGDSDLGNIAGYMEALTNFYKQHDPERVKNVIPMFARYDADDILRAVKNKYQIDDISGWEEQHSMGSRAGSLTDLRVRASGDDRTRGDSSSSEEEAAVQLIRKDAQLMAAISQDPNMPRPMSMKDPKYSKYREMLRSGTSKADVIQQMRADGEDPVFVFPDDLTLHSSPGVTGKKTPASETRRTSDLNTVIATDAKRNSDLGKRGSDLKLPPVPEGKRGSDLKRDGKRGSDLKSTSPGSDATTMSPTLSEDDDKKTKKRETKSFFGSLFGGRRNSNTPPAVRGSTSASKSPPTTSPPQPARNSSVTSKPSPPPPPSAATPSPPKPPPPPSSPPETSTALNIGSGPGTGGFKRVPRTSPELTKYQKMASAGLPQGAVENSMIRDGYHPACLFDNPLNDPDAAPKVTPKPPAAPKPPRPAEPSPPPPPPVAQSEPEAVSSPGSGGGGGGGGGSDKPPPGMSMMEEMKWKQEQKKKAAANGGDNNNNAPGPSASKPKPPPPAGPPPGKSVESKPPEVEKKANTLASRQAMLAAVMGGGGGGGGGGGADQTEKKDKPPPAKKWGTVDTGGGGGSSEVNPNLAGAANALAAKLGGGGTASSAAGPPDLSKYEKMAKMLPQGAVENAMTRDGVDPGWMFGADCLTVKSDKRPVKGGGGGGSSAPPPPTTAPSPPQQHMAPGMSIGRPSPPQQQHSAPLPPPPQYPGQSGWTMLFSPEYNRNYYFNPSTQQTSWEPPPGFAPTNRALPPAPPQMPLAPTHQVGAMAYPFQPTGNNPQEMPCAAMDQVEIFNVASDGWSTGRNLRTGQIGLIPTSYPTSRHRLTVVMQRRIMEQKKNRGQTTRTLSTGNNKTNNNNNSHMPITTNLKLDIPSTTSSRPMFQIMNEHGKENVDVTSSTLGDINQQNAVALYRVMVRLQIMDKVFFDAQRQGRLSFYMESRGEESVCVGSASALDPADVVFAQYREQGVLMWRGFTLQNFADQCFGNKDDLGKGRQMPVHYGSRELNYHTISSPLATQIPQAAGAAYAIKLEENVVPTKRCVACYFGDGAASEGDFHAGLNFASTLSCPVLFLCRNNGYAISTPTNEQFRGDGIVSRAPGYGMASIRVDGNDVWAVREATKEARLLTTSECRPVLVEFMTYRQGHHSTSDDSTRYRAIEEIEEWKNNRHPVTRLHSFMLNKGWWSEQEEDILRENEKRNVLEALSKAEKKGMRNPDESLFEDVLDTIPPNLVAQRTQLEEHLRIYGKEYNGDH